MIVMLDNSEEVWDEKDFPPHDILVYYYESAPYEGNGFAAWKYKDKFYYGDMGH